MNYVISGIVGYLAGSVIVSRFLKGDRKKEILAAALTVLEGFLPVFAAGFFLDKTHPGFLITILAPAFGRAHPFLQKRGEESEVLLSLGILLGLLPVWQPVLFMSIGVIFLFGKLTPDLYSVILIFGLTAVGSFLFLGTEIVSWGCLFLTYFAINQELFTYEGEKAQFQLTRK